MRKNAKKLAKAIFSFVLSISLVLSFYQGLYAYSNGMGMGDLVFNERREIAQGVFLDTWLGKTPSGTPKRAYSMTFNPETSDAMVVTAFGDYVRSRKTLSKMIDGVESDGYMPIGAINGDFFILDSGVPLGIVIKDGRLISHNGSPHSAVGFKDDGSVIIGTPSFEITATTQNATFSPLNFNKSQGVWGPYIYTSDFGTTTGSSVPSIEVTVNISMGSPKLGGMIAGTVSSINTNAKSTPIGDNQVVLSAQLGQYGERELRGLNVGDQIAFSFTDPDGKWDNVQQAIGGAQILIAGGQIPAGITTSDVNPYTAVGVKANGEVVFLEVDGRNSSNSVGLSSTDAAKFLLDQGCTDAIQLDGGGSSEIAARLPGDVSPTILNKPSDGNERTLSNALILVSKYAVSVNGGEEKLDTTPGLLHIYPGKTYLLPGSKIDFTVKATNDYFFPVSLPQGISWEASGGQLQGNGSYTAPDMPGTYQITATGGSAAGNATVVVISPDRITALKPNPASITILPGMTRTISLSTEMSNLKIPFSNNGMVSWQVEGDIGAISQNGVFTASGTKGAQGTIKATIGGQTASIPVTIAQEPDVIEGFENGTGSSWTATGVSSASQSVSINNDPSFAAFGDKALKLDYDLTLAPGAAGGVSGVYAFPQNADGTTGFKFDKMPTAIGMWVYGDNSRTWLRAQLTDANGGKFNIDFTPDYKPDTGAGGINWTGWKYVEAKIPAGKAGPLTLDTPVRVMCSRDEMRTKGTIYIDQIRAIYGLKNDDMSPPTGTITAPADQSILSSGKTVFTAELTDDVGIDRNNVKLLVDGAIVSGAEFIDNNGTTLMAVNLGDKVPLADGLHVAELRFTDLFGNKASQTVTFRVETGAPEVVAAADSRVTAGATFNYSLNVENPNKLKKLYLVITYDKDNLDVVDADSKTPGIQVNLESWVKKGKVVNNTVDTVNGRVAIEVDNLNASSKSSTIKAATLTFKKKTAVNAPTEIALKTGAMIVNPNKGGSCFSLPDASVDLEYSIVLSAGGFSKGEQTSMKVTDKSGNPISGAQVFSNTGTSDKLLGTTDKGGVFKTSDLTGSAGSAVSLKAVKDGTTSNICRFVTAEAASGLVTQDLSISFDNTNSVLKFNYQTGTAQTGTTMQIMEKNSFTGSFTGSTLSFAGTDNDSIIINGDKPGMVRAHSVDVTGLKPGTAYVYRFKDSSGKVSATREFTWPDTSKPYSFVFMTDPQGVNESDYSLYAETLQRAFVSADNPAFVMLGGDMVDNGNNINQWNMFFNASNSIFSRFPVMAAAGNHEKYNDSGLTNYRTYMGLPSNGPAGMSESAYSFETNDALFMVMNTQESIKDQLEWMQQTVSISDKKWKIVVMHRGLYSGFYDESELRKTIAPAFDQMGIDLVLNGHDHTYLRTTMKNGVKTSPGNGTTYITGGSSGTKYYDAATSRSWTEVLFDMNKPVFTVFKVLPDRISVVSSHIENGKTVENDRFDIVKK